MALRLRNGIFIHVPKVGGTWVTGLLKKLGLVVESLPQTHAGMAEILEKRPDLEGVKSFCFVRHPFGWYQSFWAYRMLQGWDMNNVIDVQCRAPTFAEFIKNVVERMPGHLSGHLRKLTGGVTHVGRFEALKESMIMALTALGEKFDPAAVYGHPEENVSARMPGHGLDLRYPPDLLERLYAAEEWAFRTFGYGIMGLNGAPAPTIWLTGLPSAGKTTLARLIESRLKGSGTRAEVLDGDEMRTTICRGLGFSKEDRDENVRRIVRVAALLARNGVVPVVALVSPFRSQRAEARAALRPFVEIHVKCPPEVCIRRDVKGLYRRAAAGEVAGVTGFDAPYEPPTAAEVVVDTEHEDAGACVKKIIRAVP